MKLVPRQYHNLIPLFTKTEADKLLPHWYIDHAIPLLDKKKPLMGHMYSMSDSELQEVRK